MFAFENFSSLQNAETIVAEIQDFTNSEKYFTQTYSEKLRIKTELEQNLIDNFNLKADEAKSLAELHLIWQPLTKAINQFTRASKFDEKDALEQEQMLKEFLKQLSSEYPISTSRMKKFFDASVERKKLPNPLKAIYDLEFGGKYGVWKQHAGTRLSQLGLNLAGDGLIITAPFMMAQQEELSTGLAAFLLLMTAGRYAKSGANMCFFKMADRIEKQINRELSLVHHYGDFTDVSRETAAKRIEAGNIGIDATMNTLKNISDMPSLLIQPIGAIALLSQVNPYLCLASLGGMLGTAGIMGALGAMTSSKQKQHLIANEEAADRLDQTSRAMQEIRLNPSIAKMEDELVATQNKGTSAQTGINYLNGIFGMGLTTTGIGTDLVVVGLAKYLGVPATQLFSVLMYTGQIEGTIRLGLQRVVSSLAEDAFAVNRLAQLTEGVEDLVLPGSKTDSQRVGVNELKNHKISIRGLNFKSILKDVNLDIEEGEFVTITGPSGIGKSTLLKNILGILQPDEGSVAIGGVETLEINKFDPEKSLFNLVAYADQRPQVMQGLSLRDNILMKREGISDEKIISVMQELGLYREGVEPGVDTQDPTLVNFALDDTVSHDLSGGQKVRLGLVRALAGDAKILVLDEPSASLDSSSAREVRKLLRKIKKNHPDVTIVCVTHDQDLIEESKRIGKSISLAQEVNNYDSPAKVAELIREVQPDQPESLEEFFMETMPDKTGVDFYDLRRILGPETREIENFGALLWGQSP